MHNPAFRYPEYKSFFIAERSDTDKYRSGPSLLEWENEEIIMIRKALEEITRHRILNATDVEDLVQETLLTMITKHPEGELKKGLLVWCQGILRNKVGNYYRKSQRHASFQERHSGESVQNAGSLLPASPEITVSNKELQTIVAEKLAEFPPDIRRVMELLVSGFEAGEIVDQLYPERYQNVINRLYRGRKKLARELIKCGFGPDSRREKDRNDGKESSEIQNRNRIA